MDSSKLDKVIEEVCIKAHEPVHDIDSMNGWMTQMLSLINKMAEVKLPSSIDQESVRNSSFDPEDWPSARYLAHRMLDSSLDFMQHVRDRPVWRSIPCDVSKKLENESLPEHSHPLSEICEDVLKNILPYSLGNTHPRFWGWVQGEGTLGGVLGDMIAASMNSNCGGLSHSAVFVERAVINWMRKVFRFPDAICGGVLVTGTMMATVTSISVARHRASLDLGQSDLFLRSKLVVYASTETHLCVPKALKLLGFGPEAIRFIPVGDDFRINIVSLKTSIRDDRDNGLLPFAIVGNAGTVSLLADQLRCEKFHF